MANEDLTMLKNLIDPEVMASMISAKIPKAIVVTPFATIDRTLVGRPGDEITVPVYGYIGDAIDVAEGEAITYKTLSTSTRKYKIKKAGIGTKLTDEAILSAYGDPMGEATKQIGNSIASKIDQDAIEELLKAKLIKDLSTTQIGYDGIVDTIDLFNEEINNSKVMFISPNQVTTLRKDANFISADKYGQGTNVIMTGEIGRIANTIIVPSRRIVPTEGVYTNPIVQLTTETQTEEETPALTLFLKRDVNVETERDIDHKLTKVNADEHYVAALTNESRVVLAKFKA